MKNLLYLFLFLPVLLFAQPKYGVEAIPMCWSISGTDSSVIRYVLISSTGKPVKTIAYENAGGSVVTVAGGSLSYGYCDLCDTLENGSVTWLKLSEAVKDSIRKTLYAGDGITIELDSIAVDSTVMRYNVAIDSIDNGNTTGYWKHANYFGNQWYAPERKIFWLSTRGNTDANSGYASDRLYATGGATGGGGYAGDYSEYTPTRKNFHQVGIQNNSPNSSAFFEMDSTGVKVIGSVSGGASYGYALPTEQPDPNVTELPIWEWNGSDHVPVFKDVPTIINEHGKRDTTVIVNSTTLVIDFAIPNPARYYNNIDVAAISRTDTATIGFLFLPSPYDEYKGVTYNIKSDSGIVQVSFPANGAYSNSKSTYFLQTGQKAIVKALFDNVVGSERWKVEVVWDSLQDGNGIISALPLGNVRISAKDHYLTLDSIDFIELKDGNLDNEGGATIRQNKKLNASGSKHFSVWDKHYDSRPSVSLQANTNYWWTFLVRNNYSYFEWVNGIGLDTTNNALDLHYGSRYSPSYLKFIGQRVPSGTYKQNSAVFDFTYTNGNTLDNSPSFLLKNSTQQLFKIKHSGKITLLNDSLIIIDPSGTPNISVNNSSKNRKISLLGGYEIGVYSNLGSSRVKVSDYNSNNYIQLEQNGGWVQELQTSNYRYGLVTENRGTFSNVLYLSQDTTTAGRNNDILYGQIGSLFGVNGFYTRHVFYSNQRNNKHSYLYKGTTTGTNFFSLMHSTDSLFHIYSNGQVKLRYYSFANVAPNNASGAISNQIWTAGTPSFLRSQHGVSSGTTDASSDITITIPAMPDATYEVQLTLNGTTYYGLSYHTLTTTTFKIRAFDGTHAAVGAGINLTVAYDLKDY